MTERGRVSSRSRPERDAAPFAGLAARLHHDLDVVVEYGEHFHQAFGRVSLKITAEQTGQIRLRNPQQFCGLDLGQPALLDQPVQFNDNAGFQQQALGVGQLKIGENIAAAPGLLVFRFLMVMIAVLAAYTKDWYILVREDL